MQKSLSEKKKAIWMLGDLKRNTRHSNNKVEMEPICWWDIFTLTPNSSSMENLDILIACWCFVWFGWNLMWILLFLLLRSASIYVIKLSAIIFVMVLINPQDSTIKGSKCMLLVKITWCPWEKKYFFSWISFQKESSTLYNLK